MRVPGDEADRVVLAVGQVELSRGLLGQHQRQVEGGRRARDPVVLHQRAEHPRLAVQEPLAGLVLQPQVLQLRQAPAGLGIPQPPDRGDAALEHSRSFGIAAVAGQGVERVEALAQVVRAAVAQGPAHLLAVER